MESPKKIKLIVNKENSLSFIQYLKQEERMNLIMIWNHLCSFCDLLDEKL